MPCPHNEITIVQRSQRQSAVAAAAYQSGEKLFCEYDQQVKHYPEKRGIVHNEILLPANAPPEYADRNTLWNAAEAVEKQWNSQLARRWVLTIPREIPPDQYAVLVREFCEQQFVSKGMIADFAIHAPHPPGHNPHAHVLLTMRAMDEHGKWLPLYVGSAATATADTVSCLTTGRNVSARSSFPIRCFASGFGLLYFPLISCSLRSFTTPRTKRSVPSAARSLRPPLTASNTARTAASALPADRQPSA